MCVIKSDEFEWSWYSDAFLILSTYLEHASAVSQAHFFSACTWLGSCSPLIKDNIMASPAYPGSTISRGVKGQAPFHCSQGVFISVSASRYISIKNKWERDLRIKHCIFFIEEEPKFQCLIGNILQSTAIPKWAFTCSDPSPNAVSFLMPPFWPLRDLSHRPQEEISDETTLRKNALSIASDIHLFEVCV